MSIKKIIMPIKGDVQLPLSDNKVLMYDSSEGAYYSVEREELLRETYLEFEKYKQECEKRIKFLEEQYSVFLETYKETNAKMIKMIEEIM